MTTTQKSKSPMNDVREAFRELLDKKERVTLAEVAALLVSRDGYELEEAKQVAGHRSYNLVQWGAIKRVDRATFEKGSNAEKLVGRVVTVEAPADGAAPATAAEGETKPAKAKGRKGKVGSGPFPTKEERAAKAAAKKASAKPAGKKPSKKKA